MVQIIAILDVVGAIFFFLTIFIAFKNYKKTKEISDYWKVFMVAALLGFFWASGVALEWFGFYPQIMDEVEQALVASMATAFAIAALLTTSTIIKPTY